MLKGYRKGSETRQDVWACGRLTMTEAGQWEARQEVGTMAVGEWGQVWGAGGEVDPKD